VARSVGRTDGRRKGRRKGLGRGFPSPRLADTLDKKIRQRAHTRREMATKSKPGVAFMRKDEIAKFALQSPLTVRESEAI
jgi:hypothetical protein